MKQLIKNILKEHSINESKDTEIERNLKAINVLLSLVSWDGLCDIWVEYNPTDMEYEIKSKSTASYFGDNDVEEELESLENLLRSMGIRVYIYTPWYVENCEDEVKFMNESENEKSNYLNVIKQLVEPFKNEDCVCDIDVSYDDEDDMYSVYVVASTEELREKFFYVDGIQQYLLKLRVNINKTIVGYLPIENLYVGSYGKPNCEWSPINESKENKQEKKFNTLLQNIEDYLNSNDYPHVKKITLDYFEPNDSVAVNVFYHYKDAVRLGEKINRIISDTGGKIMEDLKMFPLKFSYYIHFDKELNESKEESKKEIIETILNTMVLPEYDHVICGFKVKEPHERFDTLGNTPFKFISVTVTFIGGRGTKLWPQTARVQEMYEDILDDIWDVIYNYTNEGVDVYYETVKDCGKENIYLKESKEEGDKKKSLIKNIRDVGLYDFIRMMGLSLNEIQSQVGQIPREMLEQFIKDYVSNEGSQYSSVKPDEKIVSIDVIVGGNAIIDFIYYDGKFLSFEVTEHANGFSKEETDQYIEGSKNYGYNTIFKIVEKIIRKIN